MASLRLATAQLVHAARALPRVPAAVRGLWTRDFRDARLILEQDGDLRYFAVSGRLQRLAVRSALVAGAMTATTVLVLAATAAGLQWRRLELERTQRDVYAALLGVSTGIGTPAAGEGGADMRLLAEAIRDRDRDLRQLVASATSGLADQNAALRARLGASGLTEQVVALIQSTAPAGGVGRADARLADPLVSDGFTEASAANLALRSVLEALPGRMPVGEHEVTSGFGIRRDPVAGDMRFHTGTDLVTAADDTVRAVKQGEVTLAGTFGGYGNTVVIRHERGVETLYGHLARIDVQQGQRVTTDTVIGLVGNTGRSTGKHLHFEVSVGEYPVDPMKVIQAARNVQQN